MSGRIDTTRAFVCTRTPFFSHHFLIIPPATGVIMRGTMRSPISTTVRWTPRVASASRMMQPMKPAPICSTRDPGFARAAMARASASVQQVCTAGRSIPTTGGLVACAPVAISRRSYGSVVPSLSLTCLAFVSTRSQCPATALMRRRSKCPASLRR